MDGSYSLFHSSMVPPYGANSGFYANPEVDRLYEDQRRELDIEKRYAIFHEIHRILAEDQPFVFALTTPRKMVWRRTIRGIAISSVGPYDIFPGAAQWWLVSGPQAAM